MTNRPKTFFIKTFGCQMNEADSEKIAAFLEQQGHTIVNSPDKTDMVVINTCSVRESAENRVYGLINNIKYQISKSKNTNKKAKILRPKMILTGCMLRYPLKFLKEKMPEVDEFVKIGDLLSNSPSPKRKSPTHALVPIMEGCDYFCSYCVVPYARGRIRSRPFEEVVCEVEELVRRGYKEITLLGQNVNSYGKDFPQDHIIKLLSLYDISIYHIRTPFAVLLYILNKIKGLGKIKFLTSNPWDLTDEMIEAMKLPKIDRYFHLPVQSGDDEILQRMNRHYTAKQYLELIKKIRRKIHDVKIGTDIIVGFPGETKAQFQHTVDLCKKVGFIKAYIARYSPRPGTAAYKLKDDVSAEEKRRRWRVLEELVNKNY